jgi:hypothetical protein
MARMTDTCRVFIAHCFGKDGVAMAIRPYFKRKYIINGEEYALTETILDEMIETGKVKCDYRDDKCANITGVVIKD